jgi:hypothetical protein
MRPSEIQDEIRATEEKLRALKKMAVSTRPFDAPPVRSPQETGAEGALVAHQRYSPEQFRRWARMGGRKPNRTYEEIKASPGRP